MRPLQGRIEMKRSYKSSVQSVVLFLLVIVIIQSALLLLVANEATPTTRNSIQSIVITFFFIIFICLVFAFYYVPFKIHRAIKELQSLIAEISDGNYNKAIDPLLYDADQEIQRLVASLQKLLTILNKFDIVKSTKIFEQNQRILQLINLLPQGIIILTLSGDLVYCNDVMRRKFNWIQDGINLNEVMFKDLFENKLFDVVITSLRNGNNLYNHAFKDLPMEQATSVNGSIIRDRNGNPIGGVYVIELSKHVTKVQG